MWSRRELIPLQPRGKQDGEQRGEATRRKDENYEERESSRWSVSLSFFFLRWKKIYEDAGVKAGGR